MSVSSNLLPVFYWLMTLWSKQVPWMSQSQCEGTVRKLRPVNIVGMWGEEQGRPGSPSVYKPRPAVGLGVGRLLEGGQPQAKIQCRLSY